MGVAIDPATRTIYWTNTEARGEAEGSIGWARLDRTGGGQLNTAGAALRRKPSGTPMSTTPAAAPSTSAVPPRRTLHRDGSEPRRLGCSDPRRDQRQSGQDQATTKKKAKADPGDLVTFKVKAVNQGDIKSKNAKVCMKLPNAAKDDLKKPKCKSLGKVKGRAKTRPR